MQAQQRSENPGLKGAVSRACGHNIQADLTEVRTNSGLKGTGVTSSPPYQPDNI